MSMGRASDPFGVYVHIPFCTRRCDYCAFATFTDRDHLMAAYVDAVIADVDRTRADGSLRPASSVFVGGGTPSALDPADLVRILEVIPRMACAEVTIECNPDSVSSRHFDLYVAAGVDRVSFGVQSMVPHVLAALGRTHDPDNVDRAVTLARAAGIERHNLDLIYGGAGETIDDWRTTVERAIELSPDHVSAYALTVEPGTPLALDPARHPDDDEQADKYLLADALLTSAGLVNYEISNWSSPGAECRHNLLYWGQGDYLGFGSAAHSHVDGRRWWNVRTPDRYIDLLAEGASPESAVERLDHEQRRQERMQLALRMSTGVPLDAFDISQRELVDGLLEEVDGRLRLTVEGRLLANEVAVRLR